MITDHAEGTFASLRYFLGGDHPSQTTHHTMSPDFDGIRIKIKQGWYFNNDSTTTGAVASMSPSYPTHPISRSNVKL